MLPRTTLTARWCALADFKSIAEDIVSSWPELSAEQAALIGSVIGGGK